MTYGSDEVTDEQVLSVAQLEALKAEVRKLGRRKIPAIQLIRATFQDYDCPCPMVVAYNIHTLLVMDGVTP